jgi:hypothetical protein
LALRNADALEMAAAAETRPATVKEGGGYACRVFPSAKRVANGERSRA